jgi:hypothetical protein
MFRSSSIKRNKHHCAQIKPLAAGSCCNVVAAKQPQPRGYAFRDYSSLSLKNCELNVSLPSIPCHPPATCSQAALRPSGPSLYLAPSPALHHQEPHGEHGKMGNAYADRPTLLTSHDQSGHYTACGT